MQFHKSKAAATLNYKYGAVFPREAADLIDEQLGLARKYRNDLIRIELDRRAAVDTVVREHSTDVVEIEDDLAVIERDLETLDAGIRARNAKARSRTSTKPEQDRKKELRDIRAGLRHVLSGAKSLAREEAAPAVAQCNEKAGQRQRETRAACGVYWGTYLTVEKAFGESKSSPKLRFRRWDGRGKVAVQLQSGLSVKDAFAGDDSRLRIVLEQSPRKQQRAELWIRVGSEGRDPIWGVVPFVMHRPLPAGASIKWCYVLRKPIAGWNRWSVVFALDLDEPRERPDTINAHGNVAIDLGWRLVPEGLRVAYWVGDDGREGQLVITPPDLDRLPHRNSLPASLQRQRDENFDAARDTLAAWLESPGRQVPNWLTLKTGFLRQWRSQERLAGVVREWATARFAGDQQIFGAAAPLDPDRRGRSSRAARKRAFMSNTRLEIERAPESGLAGWAKQDRHLWQWHANTVRKALAWRDCLYRNFAALMRRRYATAWIEDTDWARLMRAPAADASQDDVQGGAREYQRVAAVGSLGKFLRESMDVREVEAKNTTQECPASGEMDRFDAGANLFQTCQCCGITADQDRRACFSFLARATIMDRTLVAARLRQTVAVETFTGITAERAVKLARLRDRLSRNGSENMAVKRFGTTAVATPSAAG